MDPKYRTTLVAADPNDDVNKCSFCFDEILNYFLFLPTISTEFLKFACVSCLHKGSVPHKSFGPNDRFYFKQHSEDLIKEFQKFWNEIQDPEIKARVNLNPLFELLEKVTPLLPPKGDNFNKMVPEPFDIPEETIPEKTASNEQQNTQPTTKPENNVEERDADLATNDDDYGFKIKKKVKDSAAPNAKPLVPSSSKEMKKST